MIKYRIMKKIKQYSIKNKILTLILVALVPLFALAVYLIFSIMEYSGVYKNIVGNVVIANDYNLNFKEQIDESCYKLVVGYTTFEKIGDDSELVNPYTEINMLRRDVKTLSKNTDDIDSIMWLESIKTNLDSLEQCVSDIRVGIESGGQYDENLEILDNSVYILTELIQEDIQQFIYCQAENMGLIQEILNTREIYFIVSTVIMLAALLAMIVIIAVNISRSITVPIKELVQVTDKVAAGDMSARSTNKSEDELGILSDSFNSMTLEISQMMDKIKDDQYRLRNTEIRLLQEQINPHFLYNALDTIIWLIESDENEKAVNMIMSLSSFFKLILSHGREYITIKDEESHIRAYLEIQQIRYADILEYDIDISPSIYDYEVLKMTLQPIVENALYHGIKYKRSKGRITVTGDMKNGLIELVVKDDGVGMDKETRDNLMNTISKPCSETFEGFGLANVNERIKMNFGEQYGIDIESTPGVGTIVTVTVPAVSQKGGTAHE